MPYPILMLFLGPAEIRAMAAPVITALVTASYVSGLGSDGTPCFSASATGSSKLA